jgi:acyl-coenzyme A thioesterase PaaI-like protein
VNLELADKNAHCYACGPENRAGLRVPFHPNAGKGSCATYQVQPEHIGWPGLIHGGILFSLMDEALGWALYYQGLRGMTARAETRFRAPAPVGTPLLITGSILEQTKRLVRARAEVRRNDGSRRLLAESNATMFLLGPPAQD